LLTAPLNVIFNVQNIICSSFKDYPIYKIKFHDVGKLTYLKIKKDIKLPL